jgi:hypothetical protein
MATTFICILSDGLRMKLLPHSSQTCGLGISKWHRSIWYNRRGFEIKRSGQCSQGKGQGSVECRHMCTTSLSRRCVWKEHKLHLWGSSLSSLRCLNLWLNKKTKPRLTLTVKLKISKLFIPYLIWYPWVKLGKMGNILTSTDCYSLTVWA